MSIAVNRPVTIKAVVTEQLKRQLAADLQSALARLESEISQLESQDAGQAGERGAGRAPPDAVGLDALAAEKRRRQQQREQVLARMRELARLEDGQEIVQGSVEGEVQVRPGDDWNRLFSAEIVLKDGKVVAIRE